MHIIYLPLHPSHNPMSSLIIGSFSGHEAVPHTAQNHLNVPMTGSDPFAPAVGV